MFSKAIYDPAKTCAVEGLVETCIPGRFTPRKVAAFPETTNTVVGAPSIATDVEPKDGRKTGSGGGNSSGGAGCLRASSSSTTVGTVFRVVPNGLGNHSILAGRGGAAVAGVAPSKRLCGSRSTPVLLSQRSKVETCKRAGTPPLNRFVKSPNSCSDSSARSATSGRTSGPIFAEKFDAAMGRAAGGDGGGSRRSSREVSRTHSGSRGASPTQRRISEQLALDLAAVRSL